VKRVRASLAAAAARLLPVRALASRSLRGRALVVALHRVNDVNAGDGLTLGTTDFDTYCRFFADHCDVVPLGEIVERLERGAALDRQVAITFDDGYRDNYENAAPVLARHGLPATFFVTTGFIETDVVAPWDRELPVPPGWMSWEEVRKLHEWGFAIGSHTIDHVDLGRVGEDAARRQLSGSRAMLRERLGVDSDLFAYPFGGRDNMTDENRSLVRELGFRCCASCFGGLVESRTSPFRLPRVALSSWYASADRFALDLALDRL
jgi:peptidoglycan/xylan/chitin deacetylase (PgdA/CDA1 family)